MKPVHTCSRFRGILVSILKAVDELEKCSSGNTSIVQQVRHDIYVNWAILPDSFRAVGSCYVSKLTGLDRKKLVPTVSQPTRPSPGWDTVCVSSLFFVWRKFRQIGALHIIIDFNQIWSPYSWMSYLPNGIEFEITLTSKTENDNFEQRLTVYV